MPGSLDITWEEFKTYLTEHRDLGLSFLQQCGRYTPFIFKGEKDGDITLMAGYRVIQLLSKELNPRITSEYKAWRVSVVARDEYQCTKCGSEEELHAHHIEKVSEVPNKIMDMDNGITLCGKCHREIHKNG